MVERIVPLTYINAGANIEPNKWHELKQFDSVDTNEALGRVSTREEEASYRHEP